MWILDSLSSLGFSFRFTIRYPIRFCLRRELDAIVHRDLKRATQRCDELEKQLEEARSHLSDERVATENVRVNSPAGNFFLEYFCI